MKVRHAFNSKCQSFNSNKVYRVSPMELNTYYNNFKPNSRVLCVIGTFSHVFFKKPYSKSKFKELSWNKYRNISKLSWHLILESLKKNNTKDKDNIIVTKPKRLVFAMGQMYVSLIPVLVRFILASPI